MFLVNELDFVLQRATARSQAMTTSTKVLLALRFYASGSFQNVLADTIGVTQPSVSHAMNAVTNALYQKSIREIKMPNGVI